MCTLLGIFQMRTAKKAKKTLFGGNTSVKLGDSFFYN